MSNYQKKPKHLISCAIVSCGRSILTGRSRQKFCAPKCAQKDVDMRRKLARPLRMKKNRVARIAKGLCTFCSNTPRIGRVTCDRCIATGRRSRLKRVEAGLCGTCGEPATVGKLCLRHAEENNVWNRERNRQVRQELIAYYGSYCACCGEDAYEFLTFDHINNDGAEQKRKIGKGKLLYYIYEHRPTDIQILCYNCNCAKGNYGGVCPHQRMIRLVA